MAQDNSYLSAHLKSCLNQSTLMASSEKVASQQKTELKCHGALHLKHLPTLCERSRSSTILVIVSKVKVKSFL